MDSNIMILCLIIFNNSSASGIYCPWKPPFQNPSYAPGTRPLVVLNSLAKLGATGALGSYQEVRIVNALHGPKYPNGPSCQHPVIAHTCRRTTITRRPQLQSRCSKWKMHTLT